MKKLNKSLIAISLSLVGVLSSVSAIAMVTDRVHEQKVEVKIEKGSDAKVFVSTDGDIIDLNIPVDVLKDKAALEQLLADVPEDVRDELVNNLSRVHLDGDHIQVFTNGDKNLTWVNDSDGNAEKVIIVEIEDGKLGHHKVIKKQLKLANGKVVKFKDHEKAIKDTILTLIESAELTADDLDKIQQAIDAKR